MKTHVTRAISIAFFSCLLSLPALAARRTVQFVGAAISHTQKIRVDQFPNYTACSVVIVNTGSTAQHVVDVKFYAFDPTTAAMPLGTVAPTLQAVYNIGSPANTPACVTGGTACTPATNIDASGGFYVGVAYIEPAALAGKSITLCSGYFTVEDANAATPGSMTASGGISYVTELGLTGGQFNGALYVSGTHVGQGAKINADAASTGTLPGATDAMQMNLYCSDACFAGGANGLPQAYCDAVCGKSDTAAPNVSELNLFGPTHNRRNSSGFVEETDANSAVSVGRPFHGISGGISTDLRGLLRTANPHFAGGYVQEMIVGPFESICSGNEGYGSAGAGGSDFSHAETIEADNALRMGGSPPNGPPERLFCAHTHMKDSPFGYVSNAIQFSINGGMAF